MNLHRGLGSRCARQGDPASQDLIGQQAGDRWQETRLHASVMRNRMGVPSGGEILSGSVFWLAVSLPGRLLAIGTFALKHYQGVATGAALGAITEMPTSQTL